ncbi:MAG TPA: PorT family protein [Bacteroidetes bacterium]|nr:PorT family protein [Bacteroidota bacterium]
MKILSSIICAFFFLSFINSLCGQSIGGGLILGFNASQVDGDQLAGYHKAGLNIGLTGIIPINKKMAIGMEILVNQKGSVKNPSPKDPSASSYKLRLDYLDIPVLFMIKDKQKAIFSSGFSYGTLVRFFESVNASENLYPEGSNPYSPFDINWMADIKYSIIPNLYINYRFAYSIIGIRTYVDYMGRVRQQHNHYMSFRLVYLINY